MPAVREDSSGAYTFTGLANGGYTVTPTKSGYTFNPTNQSMTVNGANLASINFTAQAPPPPPPPNGIAIDAKVWRDQPKAASTGASPTFSTRHGNELLLAFIATDYITGPNTTVKSVTGAGVTWALVARTNTQSGTSEIWRAFATALLSKVSVKATLSQSVVSSMTVMSFVGVDPSAV